MVQRRVDDSVDFYRGWDEYVEGFGDLDGSMWLGLEDIHMMTTNCDGGSAQMFVYLETFTPGESAYALYTTFSLGDANTNYILAIGGLSGTAGQALTTGIQFSTYDNDHDLNAGGNCAINYHGAWWYTACHSSNLNGVYYTAEDDPFNTAYAQGVCWQPYKGYHESMKYVEMKIHC